MSSGNWRPLPGAASRKPLVARRRGAAGKLGQPLIRQGGSKRDSEKTTLRIGADLLRMPRNSRRGTCATAPSAPPSKARQGRLSLVRSTMSKIACLPTRRRSHYRNKKGTYQLLSQHRTWGPIAVLVCPARGRHDRSLIVWMRSPSASNGCSSFWLPWARTRPSTQIRGMDIEGNRRGSGVE